MAPHPRQRPGCRGTVRPLAPVVGLRPLLGVPEWGRRARTIPSSHRTTRGCRRARIDQHDFPDDLTDKAIEWLHAVRAQDATKPWVSARTTGCSHTPHHVAKAWADKVTRANSTKAGTSSARKSSRGKKQLGVIPQDTELTQRPDLFPARDSLNDAEKKLYKRQMEVYDAASRRMPTGMSVGCSTPLRRWVTWTTHSSVISGVTTVPAWLEGDAHRLVQTR